MSGSSQDASAAQSSRWSADLRVLSKLMRHPRKARRHLHDTSFVVRRGNYVQTGWFLAPIRAKLSLTTRQWLTRWLMPAKSTLPAEFALLLTGRSAARIVRP